MLDEIKEEPGPLLCKLMQKSIRKEMKNGWKQLCQSKQIFYQIYPRFVLLEFLLRNTPSCVLFGSHLIETDIVETAAIEAFEAINVSSAKQHLYLYNWHRGPLSPELYQCGGGH